MKKRLKRDIIIIALLVTLGIIYIPDHKYEPTTIQEVDYEDEYIRVFNYTLGRVYIGNYASIHAMRDEVLENDILIIDYRQVPDPDMQILNSYRINDIDIINEILEIICYYEKSDPSNWNRTISSMRNEWEIHNYSYMFNYDVTRTRDVDLNNADEDKYSSELLRKVLRN